MSSIAATLPHLALVVLISASIVSDAQLTGGCVQNEIQKSLGGNFNSFTAGSTGEIGHAGTCASYHDAGADFSVCRVFPVYDCFGSDGKLKMTLPNENLNSDVNHCQTRVTTPYAMCVTRDRSACSINDLESQLNIGLELSLVFQLTLGVNGTCFDLPKLRNELHCDMTRSKTRVVVKCEEDQHASFWDDSNAVIVFWVIIGWCTLSVLGTSASLLSSARKWYQEYTALHNPRDTTFEDAPLLDVQDRQQTGNEDNKKEKKGGVQQTLLSVCAAFDALQNYRELIDTTERKVPKDPKTGAVKEDHDAETNWFDGIRCVALVAVIYGHWIMVNNNGESTGFSPSLVEFLKSYESIAVFPAFLAVDTFFYMSGFLFMYLYIRNKKRSDIQAFREVDAHGEYLARHVNLHNDEDESTLCSQLASVGRTTLESITLIVHRYLRITPAIMLVMFTATFLVPYLPQGVLCQTYRGYEVFYRCKYDWWRQMLFITNLKTEWSICCGWFWYLSADFQFFVLAVIFAPLYRANRFLYIALVSAIAFASLVMFGQDTVLRVGSDFYYVSYTRAAPYFTGLLMATLMNEPTIRRKIVPSTAFQVVGNLIALAACIAAINLAWYEGRLEMGGNLPSKYANRTLNASIEALLCVFLSITTLLWGSGYGGITFRFFSHAAFRVPSKLTFSAYIIHFILLFVVIGNRSYVIEHLDRLALHTTFGGCVVWVFAAALVVHVFLEAPLTKLNVILTKRSKKV